MSVKSTILHIPEMYRGCTAPRRFRGKFEAHPVFVHDARLSTPTPTLEHDKFCLLKHESHMRSWDDGTEIENVWYKEAVSLMKELTGCTEVVVIGHLVRDHVMDNTSAKTTKQSFYATFAHCDTSVYTCNNHLAVHEQLRNRHWAQYNIWRNIDVQNPVLGNPLALLHPASTDLNDLIITEDPPTPADQVAAKAGNLDAMKRLGSYSPCRLVSNPAHKWMYFDQMRSDEALVFVQWDTRELRPSMQQVYHSSFVDPRVPSTAPLRQSCELRLFCLFDEDNNFDANMDFVKAQYPSMPKSKL